MRDTFARAAALPDPRELYVFLRPTDRSNEWHAHVSFNFRDTPERGSHHLHPASLARSILTAAASVPPVTQQIGRALVSASVSLDPPTALAHGAEHVRVRP